MPRIYKAKVSPAEVSRVIDAYLAECITKKRVPFMIEVALKLGISQDTLTSYLQKPAYADVIKKLKNSTELALLRKVIDDNKPVGGIFLLKSLFKYVEGDKLDITSNGQTLGVVQLPTRLPKVSA